MLKYRNLLFLLILACAAYSTSNLFIKLPLVTPVACLSIIGGVGLIVMAFVETQKSNNEVFFSPALGLILYEVVSFISITLGFSSIYLDLARQNAHNFFGLVDGMSAFYFSLVTFATVGYGDIYPITMQAKLWVMSEIWFSIVLIPVVIATSIAWIINQKQLREQDESFISLSNGKSILRRIK